MTKLCAILAFLGCINTLQRCYPNGRGSKVVGSKVPAAIYTEAPSWGFLFSGSVFVAAALASE
jgi:hypothetical protein